MASRIRVFKMGVTGNWHYCIYVMPDRVQIHNKRADGHKTYKGAETCAKKVVDKLTS